MPFKTAAVARVYSIKANLKRPRESYDLAGPDADRLTTFPTPIGLQGHPTGRRRLLFGGIFDQSPDLHTMAKLSPKDCVVATHATDSPT
jgi:hypothetical protein